MFSWSSSDLPQVLEGPFVVDLAYSSPDGPLNPAHFTTSIRRGDGTTTTGTGSIRLELCAYEGIVIEATTAADADFAAKTTRTTFNIGERDAPFPYWCGRKPSPRHFVELTGGHEFHLERDSNEIVWNPEDLPQNLIGPFVLSLAYFSPDGPLTVADFATRTIREDGTATRGDGHIQVELCTFEKVVVEANTAASNSYAAGRTRTAFIVGGDGRGGVDLIAPRPNWCVGEERRHFVRVNGEEHLLDGEDGNTVRLYDLPYELVDPFVVDLEFFSPDGRLTASDFTTEIRRANGTTTTGDGRIFISLCDYETITISATTAKDRTYAEKTTRTAFVVESWYSSPQWCEKKQRQHFVSVNGGTASPLVDSDSGLAGTWNHFRALPPPGPLAGPFVLTIEYSSPDDGLTGRDFTTTIRRGDGSTTTGTGSIRLELCDYEIIVVEARTTESDTYTAQTTRAEFDVSGPTGFSAPWCGRTIP